MTSSVESVPSPHPGRPVVAGIGSAALFALTVWTTESLLAGDSPLTAVLTAVTGFAFFGWIAVVVLATLGTLAALLLGVVATQRRWTRSWTAVAGALGWLAVTALPAALGTQLLPASGFGVPAVIPAAVIAGLLTGYLVGRPRVTLADAD
jgi:hypothetical protein